MSNAIYVVEEINRDGSSCVIGIVSDYYDAITLARADLKKSNPQNVDRMKITHWTETAKHFKHIEHWTLSRSGAVI